MLQVTTSIRVSSVAMTNIAILGVDGSPVKGGIGEPEIYHPVSGITNLLVGIAVTGCGVGYIAIKLKIIENILFIKFCGAIALDAFLLSSSEVSIARAISSCKSIGSTQFLMFIILAAWALSVSVIILISP